MSQVIPVDPLGPSVDPSKIYSTIFQCSLGFLACFLRMCEGLISAGMFVVFVRGYRVITKESINQISNEDKYIYMLAMSQTLALALYYFLFE
jgi:hypothetical protein